MNSTRCGQQSHDLIDFSSTDPAPRLAINARLNFGSGIIAHCTSRAIEGRSLAASQITVAIHDGAPFNLDWCEAESDRVESGTISHGQVHIGDRGIPLWVRYRASPSFLVFTLEESLLADVWHKGFDGTGEIAIRPSIGVDDPVIRRVGALGSHELSEGGPGGRLYMEGLAAMLSVHLLRTYGLSGRSPIRHKGGLAPLQMRRVLDFIDAHLAEDLGIIELAAIAGLSPHHFGEAFKTSVGTSPHRFVIERRIRHAQHLLRDKDRSIAEVARAAGFSSQSHFTTNLRRVTGVTPGGFRRSLR